MDAAEEARIKEQHDDAAMIDAPELWPLGPVLPVKKRSGECGIVVRVGTGVRVYYDTNVHDLKSGILRDVLEGREFVEYPNGRAVVDMGWIVD